MRGQTLGLRSAETSSQRRSRGGVASERLLGRTRSEPDLFATRPEGDYLMTATGGRRVARPLLRLLVAAVIAVLMGCSGADTVDDARPDAEALAATAEAVAAQAEAAAPTASAPAETLSATEDSPATEDERLAVAVDVIEGFYPDALDVEVLEAVFANENQILIDTCIWTDALDFNLTQHLIRVDPQSLETEVVEQERETIDTCINQASILDAAAHAQEVLNKHTNYLAGIGSLDDVDATYSVYGVRNWRASAEFYLGDETDHHLLHFPQTGAPVGYVTTEVQNTTMVAILLQLDPDDRAGWYLDESGERVDWSDNQPYTFDEFAGEDHVAGVLMERVDGTWKFLLWDNIYGFNCDGDCPGSLNRFNASVGHVEGQPSRDEPNFIYDFALEKNWAPLPAAER